MNFFDAQTNAALEACPSFVPLRPVVEKELLHHDILREMNRAGYLKALTFIGGTCLRLCYGSEHLSEDLGFFGGFDFKKEDMHELRTVLKLSLEKKYDLPIEVTEPKKEIGNVDTWKIKMITRPDKKDFSAQRINIDICLIPSHDRKPSMLKNHYRIEAGTSGLILFAEGLSEILCDKLIALAMRPNRVKNRDLWDIFWLNKKNVSLDRELLLKKLEDRNIAPSIFASHYRDRLDTIRNAQKDFLFELRRFLVPGAFDDTLSDSLWWEWLLALLETYKKTLTS
jgi:predicted nucleotidyltransferase component of viral defense system